MLSACGVTEYWTSLSDSPTTTSTPRSEHAGTPPSLFAGELKHVPEDFVVIEVDPSGQRTAPEEASSAYCFHAPPPASSATTAAPLCPSAEDLDDADGGAPSEDYDVAEVCATDGVLPRGASLSAVCQYIDARSEALIAALGTAEAVTEQALSLDRHALAAVVLAMFPTRCPVPGLAAELAQGTAHTKSSSSSSGEACDVRPKEDADNAKTPPSQPWWCACMPLVSTPEKEARRWVHVAVRHRYPHIRSGTASLSEAPSQTNQAELVASVDAHYVFIAAVLGADVARWMAQCAVLEGERALSEAERGVLSSASEDHAGHAGLQRPSPSPPHAMTVPFRELPDSDPMLAEPLLSDKDIRRSFHELRKRFYPFVTCTVEDGRVRLRYTPRPTPAQRRRPREEADDTDASATAVPQPPGFTYLLVRKRNVETSEMKKLTAEYLKVPESSVCVAGMKDKKGVTYQRCSVPGDHIQRLSGLASAGQGLTDDTSQMAARRVSPAVILRWPSDPLASTVELTHCAPRTLPAPVHIGELRGNHFRVRLRRVVSLGDSAHGRTASDARQRLITRFDSVVVNGFLNYFGQQRFSESVEMLSDHTGVHLFGQRYVQAVRSLYRGCPEVYDAFPQKMDARAVPGHARDAQAMTHALRQTYRMYFSEKLLTRADVQEESQLWRQICTKAICEGTPYALRAMWVHAAQSLYFNICASWIAERARQADDSSFLSTVNWRTVTLPLAGYQSKASSHGPSPLAALRDEAHAHAARALELTSSQLLESRRVAGVPVHGTHRALLVFPSEATLMFDESEATRAESSELAEDGQPSASARGVCCCGDAVFTFSLPSSCYATIFLREVLGTNAWW